MIGVSSIDSSMINLEKRVWSESLSESDSACRRFNFGFFSLGFWFYFVSTGIFAEFTDCAPHLPLSPTKGNAQGGNPFTLANQGYTFNICTLRKRTSNLGSLGFHSKEGKHRSFFSVIDPTATAFCFGDPQKVFCRPLKEGLA